MLYNLLVEHGLDSPGYGGVVADGGIRGAGGEGGEGEAAWGGGGAGGKGLGRVMPAAIRAQPAVGLWI